MGGLQEGITGGLLVISGPNGALVERLTWPFSSQDPTERISCCREGVKISDGPEVEVLRQLPAGTASSLVEAVHFLVILQVARSGEGWGLRRQSPGILHSRQLPRCTAEHAHLCFFCSFRRGQFFLLFDFHIIRFAKFFFLFFQNLLSFIFLE